MPFYPVAKPDDYPERDDPRRPWDEWGPQEQERNLMKALGIEDVSRRDAETRGEKEMKKYKYLELHEVIQEGDQSHHGWNIWLPVTEDMVGKRRKDMFSYRTRVRRPVNLCASAPLREKEDL